MSWQKASKTGRRKGHWQAQIRHENKQRHLGFFVDEIAAAKAYDAAAGEAHGAAAKLNFPEEMTGVEVPGRSANATTR